MALNQSFPEGEKEIKSAPEASPRGLVIYNGRVYLSIPDSSKENDEDSTHRLDEELAEAVETDSNGQKQLGHRKSNSQTPNIEADTQANRRRFLRRKRLGNI